MKIIKQSFLIVLLWCAMFPLVLRAEVAVSNVRAWQHHSKKEVYIIYNLSDLNGPVVVTLEVSSDGGSTYTVPAVSLSGDIGKVVEGGPNKKIIWDAGVDWDGHYSEEVRFRVMVYELTEGLVAYYPFDGDANDYSGNNNHMEVHGAILVARLSGNDAYDFSNNAYMRSSGSSLLPVGAAPRTITCWAKASGPLNYLFNHIANWGEDRKGRAFGFFVSDYNRSGYSYWGYGSSAGYVDVDSGVTADAEWHHLALSYNGTTMTMYVDGKKRVSAGRSLNTSKGPLYVATIMNLTGGKFFNGCLDDLRVYNRALAPEEVQALYDLTR